MLLLSGYVHLFSPAIGEEKRERPELGKDVVFVGCESKQSVWWKPTCLTLKHTTTSVLSLLSDLI